jgi:hypothetical protein
VSIDAASSRWADRAHNAILALAATGKPFTANDVRDQVGPPPKPNMVGPALSSAAKQGLIVKIGGTAATRRPRRSSSTAVWVGAK